MGKNLDEKFTLIAYPLEYDEIIYHKHISDIGRVDKIMNKMDDAKNLQEDDPSVLFEVYRENDNEMIFSEFNRKGKFKDEWEGNYPRMIEVYVHRDYENCFGKK